MRKTTQSSKTDLAQARKLAGQLLNGARLPVVRNLDFYREVEQHLFAKRDPSPGGGLHLSSWRAER